MICAAHTMKERKIVWRERLSAAGSKSFPKSVTWLRLRATWPSNASDSSISAASATAIHSQTTGAWDLKLAIKAHAKKAQ